MATEGVRRQRKTRSEDSSGSLQLTLLEGFDHAAVQVERSASDIAPPRPRGPRAPGQVVACGWCGESTPIPARGRVPKWCSSTCRHRAWEQRRAASSGRSAIEVVDRVVEVVRTERTVEREVVEVPVERQPSSGAEFAAVVTELAGRLDSGRIYDRDIPLIDDANGRLYEALTRRLRRL